VEYKRKTRLAKEVGADDNEDLRDRLIPEKRFPLTAFPRFFFKGSEKGLRKWQARAKTATGGVFGSMMRLETGSRYGFQT
jgi:hypothetical protein